MANLNGEKCIDVMIWVGESYKKILCREKGSCGIPVKNKRNKCYVHEAEWRGCCRKVPAIPEWVVPGQSKIFLAHRDNLKLKKKGKIFGYFVLERVEMIQPPQKVMPLEVNPTSPVQIKRLENLQQEDKKIILLKGTVYRSDIGKPIKDTVIDAEPMKGQVKEKTFTDKDGNYKLMLESGRYRIMVSAQGFETQVLEGLEILLDEKSKQDFYLTPKECIEGQTLKRTCWNGKEIVTHQCENGKWVPEGEKCPELPTKPQEKHSKCKDGKELIQECWDGSKIVIHRCENGNWIATGEKCPSFPEPPEKPNGPGIPHKTDEPYDGPVQITIDITMFESHRSCSLRFKPSGIYFVDALTADITNTFDKDLRKADILKNYKKAKNDAERKAYIKEGNELFKKILLSFRENRKSKTKIPSFLKDMVELRGELVLFNDPPIYENHPHVSFQGIRRINGDRLLQQIVAGVSIPEIPYCTTEPPTPRGMIIKEIAKVFKINQAASKRIFKKFIELFTNELKEECKLRLPHFGTFKVVQSKARKGRNPKTGEEIDIPARNTVRFKPAKNLKEAVKESTPDNNHEEKKNK